MKKLLLLLLLIPNLVLAESKTLKLEPFWDQFLTNRAGEAAYVDFPEPTLMHTNLYK